MDKPTRITPPGEHTQQYRPNHGAARLLSIDRAALYIGRTPTAVREMVRCGKLKPVRHDSRIMLDVLDLDAWIEKGKEG